MYRASFRRKSSAVSLCKSIESAIQWFQIHHGITFVTIHNPAVYLSGARVSISPTLVPRLLIYCLQPLFIAKPHGVVYQYLVPILSPETENLQFLNQQKREIIF